MQRRITHASVAPCSPSADGREVQHGDLVVIRCDDYSPPLYLRCSSERRLSWQRERDVDRHGKCVFVTFGSRGPISRVASAEARHLAEGANHSAFGLRSAHFGEYVCVSCRVVSCRVLSPCRRVACLACSFTGVVACRLAFTGDRFEESCSMAPLGQHEPLPLRSRLLVRGPARCVTSRFHGTPASR